MNLKLAKSLLSFLAPEEVSSHFELISIEEYPDYFVLEFEELKELIPNGLSDYDVKMDGFLNKIELHTFPQKGKACFLHIKRRRWTDIHTGTNYSNTYRFHKEGMKTTDELGAFLKKK